MSQDNFEHHYAVLSEVTMHYVTAGAGQPVVLLHGFPQTWFEWRLIMPALAERYCVIAPDLRGLGDTSRPAGGSRRAFSSRRFVSRHGNDVVAGAGGESRDQFVGALNHLGCPPACSLPG